jgi:serine/threonine-protein kinase
MIASMVADSAAKDTAEELVLEGGRYRLVRPLCDGGMAELHVAEQRGARAFERLVVIKRLQPSFAEDAEYERLLEREARIMGQLCHPNIVQALDFGAVEGRHFLVLEYLEGANLLEVLRQAHRRGTRLPFALACRIVCDVLAGLSHAHGRVGADGQPLNIVHRDVSPQNIVVTFDGATKLIDFGVVKAAGYFTDVTRAGVLKGKLSYMSPEQVKQRPIDQRADLFSVGVVLWELLAWRKMFSLSQHPTDIMSELIAGRIPPIRAANPRVPPELERIVERALAADPDQRYPTAEVMREELEALTRRRGWPSDSLTLKRYMHYVFEREGGALPPDDEEGPLAAESSSAAEYEVQVLRGPSPNAPGLGRKKAPPPEPTERVAPLPKPLPVVTIEPAHWALIVTAALLTVMLTLLVVAFLR